MKPKIKTIAESIYYHSLSKIYPYRAKIISLTMEELNSRNTYYDDIYNLKIDGIIIKSFITNDEIKYFKKQLNSYTPAVIYVTDFGYTVGQTLSNSTLENYFEKSTVFKEDLTQLISFNFIDRFEQFLNKISGKANASIPRINKEKIFCPATFRIMNPFQGALKIHSEKMVNSLKPLNNELLSKVNSGKQELSFFIMMQNPVKGGNLILFDKRYSDCNYNISKGLPSWKDTIGNKAKVLKLEEGDLILFNGGELLHRIEDIRGENSRITLAGFSDYSKQSDKIHYWS